MIRRAQAVLGLLALLGAAFAASSAGQGPPGGSPPGLDEAIAAMERHADKWLDKPNVVGVGIGENKAGKPVIHVYKLRDVDEGIPSDVEGVPVEQVRSGRFDPRALPTDRWPRPVPIGVSSGLADFATGTLGARVTDGTNVYALSNNHVFAGVNTANVGDAITQPGVEDGGSDPADRIATLADYQAIDFNGGDNLMDAAIAVTSAGNVGTATPPDGYGAPSTVPAVASIGMGVQKYGRTTGFQVGPVQDVNFSVDVCYFALGEFCFPGYEARFVDQVAVSGASFSAPGDSGSLMVTQGGNQPVALLFAGDGQLTIGNPIIPVLQRFGVTIDGAPPGDGPPSAPTSLSALAGDASVALTWNAPTFDGGSPVTNYRVYRGTSSGSLSFHDDAGPTTSYVDDSAANGTTYYYRVSAENSNGEGLPSAEVSATPTTLVVPDEPLATVDSFDRPNESPLSDSSRWTNGVSGVGGVETGLFTTSNTLACSKTTTCTAWRNTTQYGPDVEVSTRISTLLGTNNHIRLYARLQGPGVSTYDGYMLRTNELSGTDEIALGRFDNGAFVLLLTVNQELAVGDVLLLRVKGSTLEIWRKASATWARLGVVSDSTYAAAGYAGIGLRGTTGRLDDFGARSLSQNPPGAPTGLTAIAGDGSVSLAWNAPSFDGGSPVTNYRVYRGTSPGSLSLHDGAGASTSYVDDSAANGTTYYYRVSAENVNGEGAQSNQASAAPAALVEPVEPLPVVDAFDRGFENPLSDGGRWSNGVSGSAESGLYVPSIWLACSKSTTCTSWRNSAQYGPDVEVWARIGALPGDGNGFRLLARLQGVGTGTYDGYMVRTTQLAGADQILLDRLDNGAFVTRLALNQDLAVGDVVLLRAQGSSLEVWRRSGSTWSRLGTVTDTTYAGAGYAGVGIRGTTGRLDDFGARTMGAPPPDTEPPSVPGTLTASVFSDSQIELTWGQATDDLGPISYRIERCSGAGCSDFAEIAAGTSTTHMDVGLSASTDYSYRVRAVDAADNEGPYSNIASATTFAPPDTEPPTAPSNLDATATGPNQVDLTWDAASDNVAVTLYRIERCEGAGCSSFAEIGTSASTSFSSTGLTAATSYSYRVRAQDAVPNTGDYSNTASATTPAPPDTEPPTAPSSLLATATAPTQIDLTWTAASDNIGVTLYRIERCEGGGCSSFTEVGTSASTSFSNTGLTASTAYSYRVRAQDAVPNTGDYSNTSSATTPALPPATPVEPLPTLDAFNRRNENPLSDGGLWSNGIGGSAETGLRLQGNTIECTKTTTTCTAWRNNASFGPDVEVWARIATLPGTGNGFRLYARLQQAGSAAHSGYMLRTDHLAGTDQVLLDRIDGGAIVNRVTLAQEVQAGDTLLLRVKGSTLEAWLKRGSAWSLIGAVTDTTYTAAGRVGVGIRGKNGRLDDFGAR